MGAEAGTLSNPIRLKKRGTNEANDLEQGNLWGSQTPGKIVIDTSSANRYFKCTRFKTTNGSPVWAQINPGGGNLENYSIYLQSGSTYNGGIDGVDSTESAIGVGERVTVKYSQRGQLAKRNNADTKTQKGNYFFQQLSAGELADIVRNPNYNKSTFADQTSFDGFFTQAQITARAAGANSAMYSYADQDSNGQFSSAVAPATTTATASATTGVAPGSVGSLDERVNKAILAKTVAAAKKNTSAGKKGPKNGSGAGRGGPAAIKTVVTIKPDKPIYTGSNDFTLPYMKQFVNNFNSVENSRERIERIHVFEMIPNSFEFSQLSSQWNETERSGNYPLVDWSNYNLTKVSFRFLVVAKRLETNSFFKIDPITKIKTLQKQTSEIVNDGLLASIDEQLDNIRSMAGAPAPIRLYNVNTLLSTEYRYPYTNNTKNLQWIINDCSITATRFTDNGNSISAAEVSLTLTEYPIIARDIILIPPLAGDTPPPVTCKPNTGDPKCTPNTGRGNLWTPSYLDQSFKPDAVVMPPAVVAT